MDYNDKLISDESILKLIRMAQLGDQESSDFLLFFFEKDIKGIKNKTRLWVPGFEDEDFYQECRIMITKAIKNFNPEKIKNHNMTFIETFRHLVFRMCKARIITLIQENNRFKKRTLNISESIEGLDFKNSSNPNSSSNSDVKFYEKIASKDEGVLESLARKQNESILKTKIFSILTELEKKVFNLVLEDFSYSEMSEKLNIDEKSIDNAIQRARKKIKCNKVLLSICGELSFYPFIKEAKVEKNLIYLKNIKST